MGDPITMDVIIAFIGSAFLGSMITAMWRKLEGNGHTAKVMVLETEIHYLRKEIADLRESMARLERLIQEFLMNEYRKNQRSDGAK